MFVPAVHFSMLATLLELHEIHHLLSAPEQFFLPSNCVGAVQYDGQLLFDESDICAKCQASCQAESTPGDGYTLPLHCYH